MTVKPSPAPPPTGGRLIRIDAVASRTGKAKRTIYQDIKDGTFPKPRRIGKRAVAWWEHEIDAFNLSRPAA
jgi:prophage regulatory protein